MARRRISHHNQWIFFSCSHSRKMCSQIWKWSPLPFYVPCLVLLPLVPLPSSITFHSVLVPFLSLRHLSIPLSVWWTRRKGRHRNVRHNTQNKWVTRGASDSHAQDARHESHRRGIVVCAEERRKKSEIKTSQSPCLLARRVRECFNAYLTCPPAAGSGETLPRTNPRENR